MGWNSWDAFGASVTEAEYLDNARILAERFLPFGYDTATVDIQWYEAGATSGWYRDFAPLVLDGNGRPQPAPNRFPSAAGGRGFAPLAAKVHAMGLRFGVHVMRGIPRQAVGLELPIAGSKYRCNEVADSHSTCSWNTDMCGVKAEHPGAFEWYRAWFAQLAEWGVDFVKVDDIAAPAYHAREVELIRRAIDATGRPMVLSLSPGPSLLDQAAHLQAHANQWRVCNDFWDTWLQLRDKLVNLVKWGPYSRAGAWADADMLPVGKIGLRDSNGDGHGERDTRFTRDEQVLMLTAWSCARSPLILGGDLRRLDDWTLRLVTNPEVLALLRVPGAREWHSTAQSHRFVCSGPQGTWAAWLNTSEAPWNAPMPAWLPDARCDCWARADLPAGTRALTVPPHGARLVRCGEAVADSARKLRWPELQGMPANALVLRQRWRRLRVQRRHGPHELDLVAVRNQARTHCIGSPGRPLETMKLQNMRTTCAVAIVTFAPLASQSQSGDGRADWPGAGKLFVGTNCPAVTPVRPARPNEVVRVIAKAANRLRSLA